MIALIVGLGTIVGSPQTPRASAGEPKTAAVPGGPWRRYQFAEERLGTHVELTFYATDDRHANGASTAVWNRFEELDLRLSNYRPDSDVARLCQSAPHGEPVKVNPDLWSVLIQADKIHGDSAGAFDVTAGPLTRLWRRAIRQHQLPRPEQIKAARKLVGRNLMELDPAEHTVRLQAAGMQLDLGGIAKGYCLDQALAVLRDVGIDRALVNGGGDIAIGDPPPDAAGWTVTVSVGGDTYRHDERMVLSNCGIATSGDTEQFVEVDGVRYSHLIDPKTGQGITNRIVVTVIGPDCTTADGWATAISILGDPDGKMVIERHPELAGAIRPSRGDAKTKTWYSSRYRACLPRWDDDRPE